MPLPRIYVETSVFSYLASRDSRDLVVAAQQHVTRQWWSHISSARVQRELTDINAKSGLRTPVLCTPFELMEI